MRCDMNAKYESVQRSRRTGRALTSAREEGRSEGESNTIRQVEDGIRVILSDVCADKKVDNKTFQDKEA